MKLLARVGGEEGSGTKAVDKIGAPVSPLSVAFFRFLARDFLLEFLGAKKNCGELSCWTPYYQENYPSQEVCAKIVVKDVSSQYSTVKGAPIIDSLGRCLQSSATLRFFVVVVFLSQICRM